MIFQHAAEPRFSHSLALRFISRVFTCLFLFTLVGVSAATISVSAATVNVPAGGNLQAAIDAARPGDEIVLQAGARYQGVIKLRRKDGNEWITIRSSALSQLPGAGNRVSPAHASLMPKIVAISGQPAIETDGAAHHYRLIGLEVMPETIQSGINSLIALGKDSQTSLDQVPHHITVESCYVHGHPGYTTRRGVALNSAHSEVRDSYLADFKEVGADSQAIMGWTGPGPYKIINNYLEAAGENIMFGGGDPLIPGLVPSDIEIRGNYLFKPFTWKHNHPSYAGVSWSVKNLFELKNARRVVVEGNLMENNWASGQDGYGVVLTVRNQDGSAPWSVVEDVTFRNNIVRGVENGINILGRDNNQASEQTKRITISNNFFEHVMGQYHKGTFLQITEAEAITVTHNTVTAEFALKAYGKASPNFVYADNLFRSGFSHGDGVGGGMAMVTAYFPGSTFRRNVLPSATERDNISVLPVDNFYPRSEAEVGFVNTTAGDYRLALTSPFKGKATDSTDIGCDFVRLLAAAQNSATGIAPPLTPAPTSSSTLIAETVLNTATYTGGNFRVQTQSNLSADKRTRLMLFTNASNAANKSTGNDVVLPNSVVTNFAETVKVEARTASGNVVQLPVEFAGACPQFPELNQVNFVLSGELAGAGQVELTLIIDGQRSNTVGINVR
jgi:hypothetical protein